MQRSPRHPQHLQTPKGALIAFSLGCRHWGKVVKHLFPQQSQAQPLQAPGGCFYPSLNCSFSTGFKSWRHQPLASSEPLREDGGPGGSRSRGYPLQVCPHRSFPTSLEQLAMSWTSPLPKAEGGGLQPGVKAELNPPKRFP